MIYNLHSNPASLVHHEKLETHHPKAVWEKYENNPKELKKRERLSGQRVLDTPTIML